MSSDCRSDYTTPALFRRVGDFIVTHAGEAYYKAWREHYKVNLLLNNVIGPPVDFMTLLLPELVDMVFMYLSNKTKNNCSLVCKKWNNKRLISQKYACVSNSAFDSGWIWRLVNLTHLIVVPPMSRSNIESLTRLKKLKDVDCSELDDDNLLLEELASPVQFTFGHTILTLNEATIDNIVRTVPFLRSCKINSPTRNLQRNITRLKNLQEVVFDLKEGDDLDISCDILTTLTNLRKIDVSSCINNMAPEILNAIHDKGLIFKDVTQYSLHTVDSDSIESVAFSFPNLTRIGSLDITYFTEENFEKLDSLSKLNTVVMFSELSVEQLSLFLKSETSKRLIAFSYLCIIINSPEFVKTIIKSMPSLQCLSCGTVTFNIDELHTEYVNAFLQSVGQLTQLQTLRISFDNVEDTVALTDECFDNLPLSLRSLAICGHAAIPSYDFYRLTNLESLTLDCRAIKTLPSFLDALMNTPKLSQVTVYSFSSGKNAVFAEQALDDLVSTFGMAN